MKINGFFVFLVPAALCAAGCFSGCAMREPAAGTLHVPPPVIPHVQAPLTIRQGEESVFLDRIRVPDASVLFATNHLPDAHQVLREWHTNDLPELEETQAVSNGWINKMNTNHLKVTEGSRSTEDIFSGGGQASVPLDSRWILKGSNSPQVRVRVRKNPETGEFEPVGTEVDLPSGVGVIYEEDTGTGEQKTFLQLKKEF